MARNVTAIEAGPSISLLAAMARFDGYEQYKRIAGDGRRNEASIRTNGYGEMTA
jgi:hypothetical protein